MGQMYLHESQNNIWDVCVRVCTHIWIMGGGRGAEGGGRRERGGGRGAEGEGRREAKQFCPMRPQYYFLSPKRYDYCSV